ncbi:MAG: substrate-binding domain-containing protein [Nocardioides sp.]
MRWQIVSPLTAMVVAGSALAACTPQDRTVIGVLAPDTSSPLVAQPGISAFRDRVTRRCGGCSVVVSADGSTPEALQGLLAQGVDVVVVQALTADQGEALVAAAGSVPLVAFERWFAGADYLVSYDRSSTGVEVADAVADGIRDGASALVVDGSSTDLDTDLVEQGVRDGLAAGGVTVAAELDPTTATAAETRDWVAAQLADRRPGAIGAVVTVTDEQALGALAAVRAADLDQTERPMLTGAGAGLSAVRRIIAGGQTLSVHMPVGVLSERAADLAVALVAGQPADLDGATDLEGVPAFVYDPVVVTRDNLTDVVVRDGTFTTEQLCSGSVAAACERLGVR